MRERPGLEAAMYHVNTNGDVVECRARRRPCKVTTERHFDTLAQAYEAADATNTAPSDAPPTGLIWIVGDAAGGVVTAVLGWIAKALTGGR